MPQVPRYEQQVQPGALPEVRVARDIATPDVTAVPRAAAQAADQGARLAMQEKQRADDAWTKQTYAEMVRQKNNLLHGDGGALRKQGRDALAAMPQTQDDFEKYADELEKGASNESQRQAILQMRLREAGELRSTLQRHAGQETERLEDGAFKTLTESLTDDSVNNPAKAELNLSMLRAAANDYADRKGWNGDEGAVLRQGLVDGIDSRVHGGIVLSMLRNGNDLGAKAYFDANKDAIKDAGMRGQVENALEEGSLRGQGQRTVDSLLTQFQDLAPAREWIRENIKDPKLRDEADRRARDEFGMRSAQTRQAQEGAFVAGYNYLEQNGQLPPVGSPEWMTMTPAQRESLKRFSDKRGEVGEDDDKVLVRFMGMRPEKLAGMTEAQLLDQARPKLTDASFKRVLGMWRDSREAMQGGKGSKKDVEVKSIFSDKEMVLNALKASKVVDERTTMGTLDNNEATARTFRDFAERVDEKIAEYTQRAGKAPDDAERKKIINGMLVQKVFVDGWGADKEKPVALLSADEKRSAYVPMGSIPASKVKLLINTARANGVVGPDIPDEKAKELMKDRLQKAYGAALSGASDEEINLILGGAR